MSAVQGQRIPLVVCGPLWKKTDCFYGKLDEERAVMEMAAASGLPLLTEPERDPEKTTTYGTGEMILDALDRGFGIFRSQSGEDRRRMTEEWDVCAPWEFVSG